LNKEHVTLKNNFNSDDHKQKFKQLVSSNLKIIENLHASQVKSSSLSNDDLKKLYYVFIFKLKGFNYNQRMRLNYFKEKTYQLTFVLDLTKPNDANYISYFNTSNNNNNDNSSCWNKMGTEQSLNQLNIGSVNYLNARQRVLNKKSQIDRTKSNPNHI
jgi:hypothetical protein